MYFVDILDFISFSLFSRQIILSCHIVSFQAIFPFPVGKWRREQETGSCEIVGKLGNGNSRPFNRNVYTVFSNLLVLGKTNTTSFLLTSIFLDPGRPFCPNTIFLRARKSCENCFWSSCVHGSRRQHANKNRPVVLIPFWI